MKTKHTKGEWMLAITGKNAQGEDKYQVVADIPYQGIMGGNDETPICDICQYRTNEEAEYNAKLIVASRDLLRSLILCRKVLNKFSDNDAIDASVDAYFAIKGAIK